MRVLVENAPYGIKKCVKGPVPGDTLLVFVGWLFEDGFDLILNVGAKHLV